MLEHIDIKCYLTYASPLSEKASVGILHPILDIFVQESYRLARLCLGVS